MEPERFALVQTTMELIEPETLIGALKSSTAMPHADAIRMARKAHGILGTHFTQAEAFAVRDALDRAGIKTQVLRTAQMMVLGRQRTVGWLDVTDEALGVPLDPYEESPTPVPWSSVFVLHAKSIALLSEASNIVEVQTQFGPVLPLPSPRTRTLLEFQRDAFGIMQPTLGIVALSATREMTYVRITLRRFIRQRMPWLEQNAAPTEQFSQLVGQLIARSPQAIVSPAARKLAVIPAKDAGERVTSTRADQDERAFQNEMNWLLQLLVLRTTVA